MSDSWSQKGSALHLNISPEAWSPKNRLSVFLIMPQRKCRPPQGSHLNSESEKTRPSGFSIPTPSEIAGKDLGSWLQGRTQGLSLPVFTLSSPLQHCPPPPLPVMPSVRKGAVCGGISPHNSQRGEGQPASPVPHLSASLLLLTPCPPPQWAWGKDR